MNTLQGELVGKCGARDDRMDRLCGDLIAYRSVVEINDDKLCRAEARLLRTRKSQKTWEQVADTYEEECAIKDFMDRCIRRISHASRKMRRIELKLNNV